MMDMSFEKLLVWKKAIELCDLIYGITAKFPKSELFVLVSPMRRSSVSIAENIAEGSQRSTQKEFSHFILITKGSVAELRTEAYISRRQKLMSGEDWNFFVTQAKELDKMLRSFYLSLIKKKLT